MLGGARRVEIERWQKLRARPRCDRPRLLNAGKRRRKVQVLRKSTLNDGYEHWIIKSGPPGVEVRRRSGRLLGACLNPVMERHKLRSGRRIIWPHRTSPQARRDCYAHAYNTEQAR